MTKDPQKYLDQLFVSKVRIKALHYFFTNPEEPIHLRGVVRELNEEINAVRRELDRMEEIGLLTVERKGNRKYFTLAKDFVFYDELLAMVFKSYGLGYEIVTGEKKLGVIDYAVLTQGYTRQVPYGKHRIDMIIVGDNLNMLQIKKIVEKYEKRLGRDIYYAVLDKRDFLMRKTRRDLFMQELFMQDFIMLAGDRLKFTSGLK